MSSSKPLIDVSIVRPILIFLLIVVHSFTIYSGGWPLPFGIQSLECYKWVSHISFSIMLQGFIFVSGYLFASQVNNNIKLSYKSIIFKKGQRLILPSIIFGLIYFFLFNYSRESFSIIDFTTKILNGVGHLWFLPALFWCFILMVFLINYKIKGNIIIILSVMLILLSIGCIPFGFSNAMQYFIFFYFGFYVMYHKERFLNLVNRFRNLLVFLFIISLIIHFYIKNGDIDNQMFFNSIYVNKIINIYFELFLKTFVAISGISLFFLFVNKGINRYKILVLPEWISKVNKNCMGGVHLSSIYIKYIILQD